MAMDSRRIWSWKKLASPPRMTQWLALIRGSSAEVHGIKLWKREIVTVTRNKSVWSLDHPQQSTALTANHRPHRVAQFSLPRPSVWSWNLAAAFLETDPRKILESPEAPRVPEAADGCMAIQMVTACSQAVAEEIRDSPDTY